MTKKVEILAPAGSWETLKAAAACGADAVYLGAASFNARRNAHNFTNDDIPKVVEFCHARGIKVHLTLNILIFQKEINDALSLAKLAAQSGVDALIIQDLGLASLIHKAAPTLPLHASTQLSVHNIEGVLELANLGFSRVVLARELSKDEIREIVKNSPVEIETFVHGALCMSVSGQCYMSVFFGGCRSANRGYCAQPCRLPFEITKNKNVLSLKDLSLVDEIRELSEIGVCSFKIEGRMKRPEYVAAATTLCKKAAMGEKIELSEKEDLKNVFSRSGFTKGYFDAKLDKDMFGIRSRDDVVSGEASFKKFHSLYEGVERSRIKVDFDFKISEKEVTLTAADSDGNKVTVNGAQSQKVIKHGISEETVAEKLSKTGSTPFFAGNINVSIEEGLTTAVSEINSLRRQALDELLAKRSIIEPIPFDLDVIKENDNIKIICDTNFKNLQKYRLCFHNTSQIPDLKEITGIDKDNTIIFVPLSACADKVTKKLLSEGFKVGVTLPRAMFGSTKPEEKELYEAKKLGINDALCGNIGALHSARRVDLNIHGDFGLNITNRNTLSVYAKLGVKYALLSVETPLDGIRSIANNAKIPVGMMVYGKMPLMLVRNCPVRSFSGCKGSGCSIKDRKGIEFSLVCDHRNDGASSILNSRPIVLSDRKKEILSSGVNFLNFLFTTENKAQVEKVLEDYTRGENPSGEFTRGLYFKAVD